MEYPVSRVTEGNLSVYFQETYLEIETSSISYTVNFEHYCK